MEKIKVSLISLGCDKNRVESEYLLSLLSKEFEIVTEEVDVVVINTCAFIRSAEEESLATILDEYGKGAKVIVTGCLPMRHRKEDLLKEMPKVSAFVDNQHYASICEVVYNVYENKRIRLQNHGVQEPICLERMLDNNPHYAFLRIADGCDNCCAYCAIPRIRGGYRAVAPDKIVKEAQFLMDNYNTEEFILVAQDVTRYRYGETDLIGLIDKLEDAGVKKIRLMYCYPEMVTHDLIWRIAKDPHIVKYIDIPLQHIDDDILKSMNRRSTEADIIKLLNELIANGITVRSTFITGFPGETKQQFKKLVEFIEKGYITYAGFFPYYREYDTPAFSFDGQVKESVKKRRLKKLEKAQSKVTYLKMKEHVGKTEQVTFDYIDYDRDLFVGHTDIQHPTVDTKVYFTSNELVEQGQTYDVRITGLDGFDLIGEIV